MLLQMDQTDNGELALGKWLGSILPWNGYTMRTPHYLRGYSYDVFTSIHIEEALMAVNF